MKKHNLFLHLFSLLFIFGLSLFCDPSNAASPEGPSSAAASKSSSATKKNNPNKGTKGTKKSKGTQTHAEILQAEAEAEAEAEAKIKKASGDPDDSRGPASASPSPSPSSSKGAGATDAASHKILVTDEKNQPAQLPEAIRRTRDKIKIKWFSPELFTPLDRPGIKGISIAGQTKPGTRVYLKTGDIFVVDAKDQKTTRPLKGDEVKYLPGVVDLRGLFFFELYLPIGKYQLPISVVDPAAPMLQAAKIYHLFLDIKTEKVAFDYLIEDMGDPFNPLSDYFTVGGGANLILYNKAVPAIPSELRFSSYEFPSIRLGFGKTLAPEWRLASYLLIAPGATTNGSRVEVTNGKYIWPHLSADAIYSRSDWKWLWRENYRIRWGLRGGLQYHLVPFIKSIQFGDTTQTIKQASLQMVTVGTQFDLLTIDDFNYELLFRMHFPVGDSPLFSIKNQFSIDGSIGGIYHWPDKRWYVGLYWYGQWLKYTFSENDAFKAAHVNGTFDILYSNLEVRWIHPL